MFHARMRDALFWTRSFPIFNVKTTNEETQSIHAQKIGNKCIRINYFLCNCFFLRTILNDSCMNECEIEKQSTFIDIDRSLVLIPKRNQPNVFEKHLLRNERISLFRITVDSGSNGQIVRIAWSFVDTFKSWLFFRSIHSINQYFFVHQKWEKPFFFNLKSID